MKTFIILTLCVGVSASAHAEPVELKQHRDARAKQDLKAVVERQDGNLEWRLKHFDANRDGVLDRKELAVEQTAKEKQVNEAVKRLDQRESARRQQGDLHRFDRNKNGRLDPAERSTQRQHEDKLKADLLHKHDTNKNGKLDPDELPK